MASVAAGDLRHRVTLQRLLVDQDPVTGETAKIWVNAAIVWAQIVPLSGREFIAAGAEQSEVTGRITIRYRDDVDASMRVVQGNMYHNILAVLPDAESGREHLTLMVSEGVRFAAATVNTGIDGGNASSAGAGNINGGHA